MTDVRFEERVVTADELRRLAEAVDWLDHYDWSSIGDALAGSQRGIVAIVDDAVVGAARMVGDGVRYWYVQDVLVHPDHSDHGIASELVQRLVDRIPRGGSADVFVGLFSSPDAVGVYESLGFESADDPKGMHRWLR